MGGWRNVIRYGEFGEFSIRLKIFAKKIDLPILQFLSAINREGGASIATERRSIPCLRECLVEGWNRKGGKLGGKDEFPITLKRIRKNCAESKTHLKIAPVNPTSRERGRCRRMRRRGRCSDLGVTAPKVCRGWLGEG